MTDFQRGSLDGGTAGGFVSCTFGKAKPMSAARGLTNPDPVTVPKHVLGLVSPTALSGAQGPKNPDPLTVPKHVLGLVSSTLLSVFLILSVSVSPET